MKKSHLTFLLSRLVFAKYAIHDIAEPVESSIIRFLIIIALVWGCSHHQFGLPLQPAGAVAIVPAQSASSSQQRSATPKLRVRRLADNTWEVSVTVPGRAEYPDPIQAHFSYSGRHLALQVNPQSFAMVSCLSIIQGSDTPLCGKFYLGRVIGSLSSNHLLYLTKRDLRKLNFDACEDSAALSLSEGATGADYLDEYLVVSDALVLSGGGDPTIGYPGRIIRYDLTKKKVIPGPPVPGFRNAALSPSGRYITYEFGEDNNRVHIYDVEKNRDYSLKELFAIGANYSQVAMGWVGKDRCMLWIASNQSENIKAKFALLDLVDRRVVWQREPAQSLLPTDIHPIDEAKALANVSGLQRTYEIALADGTMKENRQIRGCAIAVCPDKARLAIVQLDNCTGTEGVAARIFVSALNGQGMRQVAHLPSWQFQKAYKEMGIKSPIWSPRGDMLVLLGERKLVIIKPDNPIEAVGTRPGETIRAETPILRGRTSR